MDEGWNTAIPATLPSPRAGLGPDEAVDAALGTPSESRYAEELLLGRGGMGEVALCHDRRIGRKVARKRLHGHAASEGVRDFVREACVQAQLEHPSIVPVYDLEPGADGRPAFTMKVIRGTTLRQVLRGLRAGDPERRERFGRHRLLSDFVRVCQAVDYAHASGVVHRDLKPENVMLGEFGEVWVLDWGIAKTEDSADVPGQAMGTPGYMAPEQARGASDRIGPASDVYALGAILFELLTLLPLNHAEGTAARMAATVRGLDARASVRAPEAEVPPELEALCVACTAVAIEDRPASVRAVLECVERHLEGDRDLALRRRLADAHADEAAGHAATALDGSGDPAQADEARARAMAAAGRALALAPDHAAALDIMGRLLLSPPRVVPAEVEATLSAEREAATRRTQAQVGRFLFGSLLALLPITAWLGVEDWTWFVASAVVVAGTGLLDLWQSRRTRISPAIATVAIVGHALTVLLMARVVGPFLLVPGALVIVTSVLLLDGEHGSSRYAVPVGLICLVIAIGTELTGLLPPAYAFEDGRMIVRSGVVELPRWPSLLALSIAALANLVGVATIVGDLRRARDAARWDVALQVWQLGHLVPPAADLERRSPDADPR